MGSCGFYSTSAARAGHLAFYAQQRDKPPSRHRSVANLNAPKCRSRAQAGCSDLVCAAPRLLASCQDPLRGPPLGERHAQMATSERRVDRRQSQPDKPFPNVVAGGHSLLGPAESRIRDCRVRMFVASSSRTQHLSLFVPGQPFPCATRSHEVTLGHHQLATGMPIPRAQVDGASGRWERTDSA